MTNIQRAPEVRGKTIRFIWTDGPTKGKTHEHSFHDDGTVEWRDANATSSAGSNAASKSDTKPERVEYGAERVSDDVTLVSYLADSGYTLTVALNFDDGTITGFASGAKEWYPVRGTFEVAE